MEGVPQEVLLELGPEGHVAPHVRDDQDGLFDVRPQRLARFPAVSLRAFEDGALVRLRAAGEADVIGVDLALGGRQRKYVDLVARPRIDPLPKQGPGADEAGVVG